MKKVLIPKQEKIADINLKSDFTTNTIQEKIIDVCHQALPLLKDIGYALVIKNKDMTGGNMLATMDLQIPTTNNPQNNIKISIPIFIKDYMMSPVDTIVMNKVAFPISDGMIKELLTNPENFRSISAKEMKESRILSKLAFEDPDNLSDELDSFINKTPIEEQKLLAITQKRGIEEFKRMQKAAEDYTEPILECIIEKTASNTFDLYYLKMQGKNEKLDFVKDNIDGKSARLLLETIGYNEKIASKTSTKSLYLKSPVTNTNDTHESLMYDPNKIDKIKTVENLEAGPVEIMDQHGNKQEGILFDLMSFSNSTNIFSENKLFLDYDKNYCIQANFQGMPTENDTSLNPDKFNINQQGVFVDEVNNIAYGPVTITSYVDSDDNFINIKFKNKNFRVKQIEGLKRSIIDGENISIPKGLRWFAFKREIKIINNLSEIVNNKFASASYKIKPTTLGAFQVSKLKGDQTKIAEIPSKQHLTLFLNRINLVAPDIEKIAEDVSTGKTITFITDFPMDSLLAPKTTVIKQKTKLVPNDSIKNHVEQIKVAGAKLSKIFLDLFETVREPDIKDILEKVAQDVETIDSEFPIIKESSAFDTLDTLFSLNVINTANSNIFLNSINKLKSTLSLLAALRIYIRLGWKVDISETDVNQAVEALNDIMRSLELLKTQSILERQEKNQF